MNSAREMLDTFGRYSMSVGIVTSRDAVVWYKCAFNPVRWRWAECIRTVLRRHCHCTHRLWI